MKRLMRVILGVGLALALAVPVWAEPKITRVELSGSQNGPSACVTDAGRQTVCNFPGGQKVVYFTVEFREMPANTSLRLEMSDERGVVIFNKAETVSGDGSRSAEITATQVFNEYLKQASDKSTELPGLAQQVPATGAPNAQRALMQPVSQRAAQIDAVLQQLQKYGIFAAAAQVEEARRHIKVVMEKGNEVATNYQLSDAQRRDYILEVQTEATASAAAVQAAKQLLAGQTNLAFPNIDTMSGRNQLANVYLNNNLNTTLIWAVSPQGIATATPEPTARPTGTDFPTPVVVNTPTAPPVTATTAPAAAAPATATATPAPVVVGAPTATPAPQVVVPTATTAAAAQVQPPAPVAAPAQPQAQPGSTAAPAPSRTPFPTLVGATATRSAVAAAGTAAPTAAAQGAGAVGAPTATAMSAARVTASAPTASPTPAKVAGGIDLNKVTPSASQDSRVASAKGGSSLPFGTIGLVAVALALGGAALWMRRKV